MVKKKRDLRVNAIENQLTKVLKERLEKDEKEERSRYLWEVLFERRRARNLSVAAERQIQRPNESEDEMELPRVRRTLIESRAPGMWYFETWTVSRLSKVIFGLNFGWFLNISIKFLFIAGKYLFQWMG